MVLYLDRHGMAATQGPDDLQMDLASVAEAAAAATVQGGAVELEGSHPVPMNVTAAAKWQEARERRRVANAAKERTKAALTAVKVAESEEKEAERRAKEAEAEADAAEAAEASTMEAEEACARSAEQVAPTHQQGTKRQREEVSNTIADEKGEGRRLREAPPLAIDQVASSLNQTSDLYTADNGAKFTVLEVKRDGHCMFASMAEIFNHFQFQGRDDWDIKRIRLETAVSLREMRAKHGDPTFQQMYRAGARGTGANTLTNMKANEYIERQACGVDAKKFTRGLRQGERPNKGAAMWGGPVELAAMCGRFDISLEVHVITNERDIYVNTFGSMPSHTFQLLLREDERVPHYFGLIPQ